MSAIWNSRSLSQLAPKKEWTPQERILFRRLAEIGLTAHEIALWLDRGIASIKACAVRSKIKLADAAVIELPPGYLVTEDAITALYAGRRYDDVTFIYQSETNKLPAKADRESKTGSTAQMCVEAAR